MIEIRIKDEMLVELEKMVNLQTKGNRNLEMNEKNLKMLYAQRTFLRENSINTLCGAFYCFNDNEEVNATTPQTMWCILCHNNTILNVNPKTQARKGLIIYNSFNGIVALRKQINSYHPNIFLNSKKKINCPLKEDERQPSKKRSNVSSNSISLFFATKEPFKKDDVQQKQSLEDLTLLIVKNHLPLQLVESSWLKRFSMHLCPKIIFPS
jgi:hypothetical protein